MSYYDEFDIFNMLTYDIVVQMKDGRLIYGHITDDNTNPYWEEDGGDEAIAIKEPDKSYNTEIALKEIASIQKADENLQVNDFLKVQVKTG